MADDLAKRLQLKGGDTVLVVNAPAGYVERLAGGHDGKVVTKAGKKKFDAIHLFVSDSGEVKALYAKSIASLKPEGMFWVSYPKKSSGVKSDLTRDIGWKEIMDNGWQGVRQIKIDDTWAATRFKRAEAQNDDQLLAKQYGGAKAHLKPIYEKVVGIVAGFGNDVTLETRQSYVAFARGTHFAAIAPSTRTRVDIAVKRKGEPFEGRLQPSKIGGGGLTHMLSVESPDEVDDEVIALLHKAYVDNEGSVRRSMGG